MTKKVKSKAVKEASKSHVCIVELPDGKLARRVTKKLFTCAIATPQVGNSGLWVVLKWGSNQARLGQEAKRRSEQSHNERKAIVLPVRIAREGEEASLWRWIRAGRS